MYKFYQLAIALQFLKIGDKKLIQSEKDRFLEYAKQLQLEVSFSDFDKLANVVEFKIAEANGGSNEMFNLPPSESIKALIQARTFSKNKIVSIVWTLINLAYADGDFTTDEKDVLVFITEKFQINSSVLEELIDCAKTIMCLERKTQWLENSNKTFKEVRNLKIDIENDMKSVAAMVAKLIDQSKDQNITMMKF